MKLPNLHFTKKNISRALVGLAAAIVVVAIVAAVVRSCGHPAQKIEKHLYGEEIGEKGLRYKHGSHIFDPQSGATLVDSIAWLYVQSGDTIGILAKNNKRAYINLNTAQLITSLDYDKAWCFACDRGVMVRHDTLYIFRRDGSVVNPDGFCYRHQYQLQFYHNQLAVNVDRDLVGLIDTACQWVLEPVYSMIEDDYQHQLYNTRQGERCIVYDYDLNTILTGNFKSIDIDWSEGIIATEHSGIQHLYDYKGKLVYQVIFKRIEDLMYTYKDKNDDKVTEETNCLVYVDYNNKRGLMDRQYHILTPPLFHSIEAQSKHVFFATFGDYFEHFGTLIDDHGKPIR